MNDAIVLWGLLLLYGLPIVTVAYWLEKKMHDTGGGRVKDYCEDCGQVEWLCICKGGGDDE